MNNKRGGFGAKLLLVLILMIASAFGLEELNVHVPLWTSAFETVDEEVIGLPV